MAQRLIGTAVLLSWMLAADLWAGARMATPRHPLDSLTAREIAAAIQSVKRSPQYVAGSLFAIVALQEPPKHQVLASSVSAQNRSAFVVLLDRDHNITNEVVVNLADGSIESWRQVPDVQPSVVIEEYVIVPEIVKSDPRLREALRRRGITNLDNVKVDAWAPGPLGDLADGSRIVRALFFYKENADSNWYSRPIEGVVAIVNLTRKTVIDVIDTGVVPVSEDRGAFDEKGVGRLRIAPKPLRIVQPQGPSFEVTGHDVAWQKWRFHFGLDPREGLVLHRVRYVDRGRERAILYRASLSEMVVPYGDPDANWAWRSAFDVGEYGIGRLASPIVKGTDVPENAVMFDFPVATDAGDVQNLRDAVALYERDGGMIWKHYDIDRDYNESRRGRQLVLGFIATVGNYDYALNWIFHQDGTLEFRADLTGIMLTKGVQERLASHHGEAGHAHYVAPHLVAPHHQHFFNFRLDLDVDGTANSIKESNTFAVEETEGNALGNAFVMQATPLASEKAAQRDLSFATQRKWKVINATAKNELGEATGYLLAPGENSLAYVNATAPVRKRAYFLNHQLWATRFREGEIHASGYYPNQSKGGEGLERWIRDDESLANEDVVLWYTTGVTHVPRPEEWPIMSVHQTGFKLLPVGFFSRNPSLDIPREK